MPHVSLQISAEIRWKQQKLYHVICKMLYVMPQKAGLLGKDASISLRDGHMVIPVDAANKRKTKDVYMTVQGVEKLYLLSPKLLQKPTTDFEN